MAILDDDKEETKEPVKGKKSNIDLTSFSENVGDKLDPYTATYNDEDLEKIVNYLKEWNTNAKHSFVSQAVLSRYVRALRCTFIDKIDTTICYFVIVNYCRDLIVSYPILSLSPPFVLVNAY
jgi:Utp13 specific WD40 associated domain